VENLAVTIESEVPMDSLRHYRSLLVVIAGLALPLGLVALMVPLRSNFADPAAALVLVAAIVAVAVVGNRGAGFVASVSATLGFDFFLTRPYERFAITHRPDIETAISLFVVGLVVTELAARNRHHRDVATEGSDYVGLMYSIAELAVSGAPASEVVERARQELIDLLHLRSCRYTSGPRERPAMQLESDGQVLIGGAVWAVDVMGLPGPELELPVRSRGLTQGRFLLTPTPGHPVSLQRRVVAVALADQVGAAVRPQLRSA
jgi:K+-sensing histidine kinase KdpD